MMEGLAAGVLTVVDVSGEGLVKALPLHPFLVKPNQHELGEIFGVTFADRASVLPYAKKLQEMGARNVLVSMAGQGAVLLSQDGSVWDSPAPEGRLINGVGGRFYGGGFYGRLAGKTGLSARLLYGRGGRECNRFFGRAGDRRGNCSCFSKNCFLDRIMCESGFGMTLLGETGYAGPVFFCLSA